MPQYSCVLARHKSYHIAHMWMQIRSCIIAMMDWELRQLSRALSALAATAKSASTISFTISATVLLCFHPSSVQAFEGLPNTLPCSSQCVPDTGPGTPQSF